MLRPEDLREGTPKETAPMPLAPRLNAVAYLTTADKMIKPVELDRLHNLITYADECHYTVKGAIVAHDPDTAEDLPDAWWALRRQLQEGRIDVIVLWHTDLDVPDAFTRADLSQPAPAAPQETPLEGNTPRYPVGSEVRYDDDPGKVRKHRYNGERNAWDALVDFDGESGWCWESDLTPAHTEGE